MTARAKRDRGSATVELVVLTPVFGALLLLLMTYGRVGIARIDVDGAARMAARELSIARDPAGSIGRAEQVAAATLAVGSPACRSMTFNATIDAASVTVEVGCVTEFVAPVLDLHLPGSTTVTATATEPRDAFREYGS